MAVGYPANKADIDAMAGSIAVRLRDILDEAVKFNGKLTDKWSSDGDLAAMRDNNGGSWSLTEIAVIRSTFAAFAKLAAISHGQDIQPAATDFFWDAKKLMGVL